MSFIDFGNTQICRLKDLKKLCGVSATFKDLHDHPPYCFECSLAYTQPSQVNAPDGIWTKESTEMFTELTDGKQIEAEVYLLLTHYSVN